MFWEKFVFLSYVLSDNLSCYGGAFNIKIDKYVNDQVKCTLKGHCGTHIDFPLHFKGEKNVNDYKASDFVFDKAFVKEIKTSQNYIQPEDLSKIPSDVDFLILKTGLCKDRFSNDYISKSKGISFEAAQFLRNKFKKLRAVGIDCISINAYKDEESGILAHKEFLCKNPEILIIEDMDLRKISGGKLKTVIVSPLRLNNADGVPVSIIAQK